MSDRLRSDACRDDLYRARTALSEAVRRYQEAEALAARVAELEDAVARLDEVRCELEERLQTLTRDEAA